MSVTLAGNLVLNLQYAASTSDDPLILLITNGVITGAFDTINGSAFLTGNRLSLDYGGDSYEFVIDYEYDFGSGFTAVALHAVPEPAVFALLCGAAAMFYFLNTRETGC